MPRRGRPISKHATWLSSQTRSVPEKPHRGKSKGEARVMMVSVLAQELFRRGVGIQAMRSNVLRDPRQAACSGDRALGPVGDQAADELGELRRGAAHGAGRTG